MALIQVCDNADCELPTGITPVEIEPDIFYCPRCFKAMQQELGALSFVDSPNKVVRRRGKGLVHVR